MGMGGSGKKGKMSEINVTPLVDVMLVLLVIFMITAPLMLNGIKLNLPKTKEVNRLTLTTQQVVLSMSQAEEYFIGKEKYSFDELLVNLKRELQATKTNVIYFRADYGLSYGKVAKVISFLKRGGVTNIALVTELEK